MPTTVWIRSIIAILELNSFDLLADDVRKAATSIAAQEMVTASIRDAVLDAKDELMAMGLRSTASALSEIAAMVRVNADSESSVLDPQPSV